MIIVCIYQATNLLMSKYADFPNAENMLRHLCDNVFNSELNNTDHTDDYDMDIMGQKLEFIFKNLPIDYFNKPCAGGCTYGPMILRLITIATNDKNKKQELELCLNVIKIILERDNLQQYGLLLTQIDVKYIIKLPYHILSKIFDKKLLHEQSFKVISKELFYISDISVEMILLFHEYIKDNFPPNHIIDEIKHENINSVYDMGAMEMEEFFASGKIDKPTMAYIKQNTIGRDISSDKLILMAELIIHND